MDEHTLLITTAVSRITSLVTTTAAVSTGLMAGVFFAFSTSVMKALAKLPAFQAITAMQGMNVAIVNPLFLVVLAGSTVSCVALLVLAPVSGGPQVALRLAGAALFLIGAIGVTAVVNVPMNDALAAVSPSSAGAASAWLEYLSRWTRYNNLRAASSVAATVLLVLGSWLPRR